MASSVLWLALLCSATLASRRLCEIDNSCKACGDGRYSFYRCFTQADCMPGERCSGAFCCPESSAPALQPEPSVLPSMCNWQTEEWHPCVVNCQSSCGNPSPCNDGCRPGCKCLPGFVRANSSPGAQCIPYTLCPIGLPESQQCGDPRREYQTCGPSCPRSCSTRLSIGCRGGPCVEGCFCKLPFVLQDAANPLTSPCVLPAECPQFTLVPLNRQTTITPIVFPTSTTPITTTMRTLPPVSVPPRERPQPQIGQSLQQPQPQPQPQQNCTDPRKTWTSCFLAGCPKTCTNLGGSCSIQECIDGCRCREPYVLSESDNKCILPSECSESCSDPRKEFIACGSACPLGCDSLSGRHCAPCQRGCFCRNGFVFRDASKWRESDCVPIEECQRVTTAVSTVLVGKEAETEPTQSTNEFQNSPHCPATTHDVSGRSCDRDSDCFAGQFCCRSMISLLKSAPQRCTCEDPNAVFNACGTLCPEYCGQKNKPVCSTTCNPSCQCAPGFIRMRNEKDAPCVPLDKCPLLGATWPIATLRDITPQVEEKPPQTSHAAVARLTSPTTEISGFFTFERTVQNSTRIRGNLLLLPFGSHAIAIHRTDEQIQGCEKPKTARLQRSESTVLLGDVVSSEADALNAEFSSIVSWPLESLIGRQIAVYSENTNARIFESKIGIPLACGAIRGVQG